MIEGLWLNVIVYAYLVWWLEGSIVMKDNVKEAGLPVSLLTITYVMALLQIFLLSTSIFPVIIIPPMLHIHSSVTNTI